MLATGVKGAQPNQMFTVTYTDGTTARFTRSVSDWAFPQTARRRVHGAGDSLPRHRLGGRDAGPFRIYQYTFALDPTKVVRSLTLPVNANVEVFAATLVPAAGRNLSPRPTPPVLAWRQEILRRQAEFRLQRQARVQEILKRLAELRQRRQVAPPPQGQPSAPNVLPTAGLLNRRR